MAGSFLLNGNAEAEAELLSAAAPLLLASRHRDPAVAASRRVLLVTGAWGAREHDEGHLKAALNALGLPSRPEGGFDRAIVNLSLWHEHQRVLREAPELASAWGELRRLGDAARGFYLAHNAHLIGLVRRAVGDARASSGGLGLADLAGPPERGASGAAPSLREILGRELRHAIDTLERNDDRLSELLRELDERLLDGAGMPYQPAWREARARLEERILTSHAVVLLGGNLDALLSALRFFRLRDALAEALRRGTNVVAMSAGALVLCERVIVYDDFARDRSEFQLYDRGLGLVRDIQVFPHCMDRIQTDDPDNLAYLAHRFRHHTCVGLNQGSFLHLETTPPQARSWGQRDGVHVFGLSGRKRRYVGGESIPLQAGEGAGLQQAG
jgi:hypothetical protein